MILLKRKHPGPEPYLWSVSQVPNHGFQYFVPFCPADPYFLRAGEVKIPAWPFRPANILFEPPVDNFEYWQEDWRGTKQEQISITARFHVRQVRVVRGPEDAAIATAEKDDISDGA